MSRRVRITFVVGNFVAGGAERHLLEMWSRIDRARFDLEIACLRAEGQFLNEVRALGWPIHDLDVGRRIYGPAGMRGFSRLVHALRRFRPHVVHGYLFGPSIFAVAAGRMCSVPAVVVAKRNVDAFESPRQALVHRWVHRLATHVTAVSERVAETVVAMGVPPERITAIPNGVNYEKFASGAVPDAGGNGRALRIGSVGCLAARKDYGTLLEAAALLKARGRAFEVDLVGDGPDRGALEAQARALGLADRIHFLGERPDVEQLLPKMDVFVLSSREEGIPNALLEAMAAARPAVATAVGGTPEVIEDGTSGWLVPAAAPEALAEALEDALSHPEEAQRRARAAQERVRTSMSIDSMVRRHEAFYERLAGEGA